VERKQQPKNELRKGGNEDVNNSETVISVDKLNSKTKNGRPPLIRVSFHNKEAAQAFWAIDEAAYFPSKNLDCWRCPFKFKIYETTKDNEKMFYGMGIFSKLY
jgi:hypothetical protein